MGWELKPMRLAPGVSRRVPWGWCLKYGTAGTAWALAIRSERQPPFAPWARDLCVELCQGSPGSRKHLGPRTQKRFSTLAISRAVGSSPGSEAPA